MCTRVYMRVYLHICAPSEQQKRATRWVCMLDANGNPDAEKKGNEKEVA